jgi:polar amino acid transport system permease protein
MLGAIMEAIQESDFSRPQENTFEKNLSSLPWWAIILAMGGLTITFFILSDSNYRDTFNYLKWGVVTTLRITFLAFPISTVIGLFVGLGRLSKNVVFFTISTMYVEVVRGIPLVVLILMIAFAVIPLFVQATNAIGAWGLNLFADTFLAGMFLSFSDFSIRSIPMEIRAVIALALGYGAFEAEVFRAGIQSISKGQIEAARSLGMNYFQSMRFIILPQAIRRVLPPLGNDFIAMLKDSSLATVLAVNELTQLTRLRRSSTFRVMEAFNVAAFLYLALTLLLSAGVRTLETRMKIEE